MEADAKNFIAIMKAKLAGKNHDDILNMDQAPIPCLYHSNKVLDVKGAKMVQARASTMDTKCVTLPAQLPRVGRCCHHFLLLKISRRDALQYGSSQLTSKKI